MELIETSVRSILTRTGGYLRSVVSHSLQPYRGCSLGSSLCGVGCYVQHNHWVTRGRKWGTFLEVRMNAAARYLEQVNRERKWAHGSREAFAIFLSSSTDPFLPQESVYGITRSLLEAMLEQPPDKLILQTHSHTAVRYRSLIRRLARLCDIRFHISVESDLDGLPGLPPPASTVEQRLETARLIKEEGVTTILTLSPLLPFRDAEAFFASAARAVDAVVIDHFIGGDGSRNGERTLRTRLPDAIQEVAPEALRLDYREWVADVAARYFPGRVAFGPHGFAGRFETPLT